MSHSIFICIPRVTSFPETSHLVGAIIFIPGFLVSGVDAALREVITAHRKFDDQVKLEIYIFSRKSNHIVLHILKLFVTLWSKGVITGLVPLAQMLVALVNPPSFQNPPGLGGVTPPM
jgi:hypothetical protein